MALTQEQVQVLRKVRKAAAMARNRGAQIQARAARSRAMVMSKR